MGVSCHRPFVPGTSLEPAVIPTAQASSFTLQYFPIMCDVPSTPVFCSESIERFPGTNSKIFLKLLVTIPVAQNYYWYNRTFQVPHSLYLYT